MTEREAWNEGYSAGSLDMDNGISPYDERHTVNPYPPRWEASAAIGIEGPSFTMPLIPHRPEEETTMGNPTQYYEDHTKREFATRLPKGVTPLPMEMSLSDHMAYFNAQHTLKNEKDMEDESRRDEVAEALGWGCNNQWEDIIGRVRELKMLEEERRVAELKEKHPFTPEPKVPVSHVLKELIRSLDLDVSATAPWHTVLVTAVNRVKNAELQVEKTIRKTRYQLANELITELVLNVAADSTWETALHHAKFHMGALAEGIERQRSDLQAVVVPEEEEVDHTFTNLLHMVTVNTRTLNKIYSQVGTDNPHLVLPKITEAQQGAQDRDAWRQTLSDALISSTEPGDRLMSRSQAVHAIQKLKTGVYDSQSNNWMQDINCALGAMPGDVNKGVKECVEAINTLVAENKGYEIKVREATKYLQLPVTR